MNEIKVVFDTQIYLRSLINSRSACGRLVFEWDACYLLYVSQEIEQEILDVLNRLKIRSRFPQITDERVAYIASRLAKAERVTLNQADIEPICRDPKDDIFLACAKVAEAAYLVSEDNDLLVIKQHYDTQILNVAAFLTLLETRFTAL